MGVNSRGQEDFITSAGSDAYYEKLSRVATRMYKYWASFKSLSQWRSVAKAPSCTVKVAPKYRQRMMAHVETYAPCLKYDSKLSVYCWQCLPYP